MALNLAQRTHRIKPSPSSMAGQRARELRAQGRDIVSLSAGEPDFDTPDHVVEAAIRAMRDSRTKYTDIGGTPDLKAAIRDKFRRENGLEYGSQEVMAGTGAKQVIFNALMCTVEAGCEVIIPAPYWVSYPDIVLLAGGTPVFVQGSRQHDLKLQPEALERAITPNTRWLILNAPGNPGGSVYSEEELRALAQVLLRHPQVWILTDDMYEHILFDDRRFKTIAQVEPRLYERTLTVNGVSKAYAMTGWRIGYAGGPRDLIFAMTKMQSHSTSNPSSISQAAATEALTGPQHFIKERAAIFQQRRDRVVGLLNECAGVSCALPQGAFYVYPSCADLIGRRTPGGKLLNNDEDVILYLLDEENLAVLQGAAYGTSPHFRISIASSMEVLEEGCARVRRACEKLG
ncbi:MULTISPECIES: aminotransferase class I/II-fold pyridoxal phosphate-dependent enzyme [unclassified Achromobacter]|uniref:aminotransferase class I/II-fold pyridoxal phosphate-dependent enzyme n=1 Tax=unclassified Achromobacter TaxID=2626865 RepID=UPI000B517312|nr:MULTISPECIES: aminotransferase class I/II-fold pyridoxal phosphate-dependent enzyme [unclassified Achromobacter]OWT74524.1 aspartate aminotransferase [Achromobacter sp. HZ34]OWT78991.1 aspartate aminotransferase [Achromobacter sp. HZ28]